MPEYEGEDCYFYKTCLTYLAARPRRSCLVCAVRAESWELRYTQEACCLYAVQDAGVTSSVPGILLSIKNLFARHFMCYSVWRKRTNLPIINDGLQRNFLQDQSRGGADFRTFGISQIFWWEPSLFTGKCCEGSCEKVKREIIIFKGEERGVT